MSVRLLSSDNEEFVVRKEIAEQSVFIENMMCDGGIDTPVFLPNVTAKVLRKVIEWCDHHCDTTTERTLDGWDKTFLLEDQETLFDLINAANYLEIKPLLNAGCTAVSEMIKGKTAKEIRTIFKVVNDFTPEEEAQILRENEWKEDPPV